MTVGMWLNEWLTTSVEARNLPRTVSSYRETVDRYIDPAIGRIALKRLEPEAVDAMLRRLTARGLSPTTVRYAHAILRIALGRAVKSGRVIRNVASLVEPPARSTPERLPLTADQARAFLAAVDKDRLAALYKLAISTGMRQGELLALRWQDVDLDGGRVTIRHTLRLGTRELAEPKTERARRTLRLSAETAPGLREHRRRQLQDRLAAGRRWIDGDFVFATGNGTPLDSRNVTKAFQRNLANAGLPHQRFHDLRHACATLLLEDGEDLGVVSRILGHSQIATTADVYAHLTPAMLERSAARMDSILARRPDAASG